MSEVVDWLRRAHGLRSFLEDEGLRGLGVRLVDEQRAVLPSAVDVFPAPPDGRPEFFSLLATKAHGIAPPAEPRPGDKSPGGPASGEALLVAWTVDDGLGSGSDREVDCVDRRAVRITRIDRVGEHEVPQRLTFEISVGREMPIVDREGRVGGRELATERDHLGPRNSRHVRQLGRKLFWERKHFRRVRSRPYQRKI